MIYFLSVFALLTAALCTVSTFLSSVPFIIEPLLSFQHLSAVLALLAICGLAFKKRTVGCVTAIALFVLTLVNILPWYRAPNESRETYSTKTLKVMLCNVLYGNKDFESYKRLVDKENPDVIFLVELRGPWFGEVEKLRAEYPYVLGPKGFHGRLFSRYEFSSTELRELSDVDRPTFLTTLNLQDRQISLVTVHLPAPISTEKFALRNRQLDHIKQTLREINGPLIVIADLNTTMWSPYYKSFVKDSRLRNTRQGFGLMLSWFVFSPKVTFLAAPTDHIFYSPEFRLVQSKLGSDIASDHLPLLATFSLN